MSAERELLNFAMGLRMHHHEHPRLRLLGTFTGGCCRRHSVGRRVGAVVCRRGTQQRWAATDSTDATDSTAGVLADIDGPMGEMERSLGCGLSSRHAMEFYMGSVACLQKAIYPATAQQLFTAQQLHAFRKAFDMLDTDGGGTMDVLELRAAMKKIGFQLSDVEVDTMAELMDDDKSGEIDFEEFMGCVMFAQAMKKGVPLEQVCRLAGTRVP
eukprot:SAG25_NODE_569_length_6863_cov_19.082200_4_plen_213_part_00